MNKTTALRPADKKLGELRAAYAGRADLQSAIKRSPHGVTEGVLAGFAHAIRHRPDLLQCENQSILDALAEAIDLGLRPERFGEAYFIRYGNKCRFQVGYQGILKLVAQSGQVKQIDVREVRLGDRFEVTLGDEERIIHRLSQDPSREAAVVSHVYAIATMSDGAKKREVWSRGRIDRHKELYSKDWARKESPWQTAWLSMAFKTVILSLCKLLPKSTAMERALAAEAMDLDESEDAIETAFAGAADAIPYEPPMAPETAQTEAQPAEASESQPTLSDAALARLNDLGADLKAAESVLQCQGLAKQYCDRAEDAHEKVCILAQIDWRLGQIRENRTAKKGEKVSA